MEQNNSQSNENENNETENNNENVEEEEYDESKEIMYIYEWVDKIPLSRQKKNIARDFNDGVLLAEMIKYHYPRLVDLHNYPNASSTKQKLSNWNTLNTKVLKKLGIKVTKEEINDIMNSKPNAIEFLLIKVYKVIHNIPLKNNKNVSHNMNTNNEYNNQMNQFEDTKLKNKNMNMGNNMEVAEIQKLQEMITEKDNEITDIHEHIKELEKNIKESEQKQLYLEQKLRELNELIIQNEINV
jgi:hypothetical protein